MFKIAICDDSTELLQNTLLLIKKWTPQNLTYQVETFNNGDDLIHYHKISPFDIIILDVIMPLLNGLDTAKELRQFDKNVKIVFLTSSPDFAIESYTVKATNYLLKPVSEEKLFATLDEIMEDLEHKEKTIAVRCASTIFNVKLNNIEYIEASNKSVYFHLADGRALKSIQPLYTYEQELTLKDGFYRCHRSYIVNLQRIQKFTQKEIFMRNGSVVPISRQYQNEFESTYFEVLFGKVGE